VIKQAIKFLFIFFGFLVSVESTWAKWELVAAGRSALMYIDTETIHKEGPIRKVWERTNFIERQRFGEMSRRSRVEYDCTNLRSRLLSISGFSEISNNGDVLYNSPLNNSWDDIAPDTLSDSKLKFVCSR